MALVIADRVKDSTTTTGTGTITLSGTAATGFQNFSVIGNGNTTYYTIAGQGTSEWEVGIGSYNSSGTTLARTTVISSSNSNAAVNFSAGTKDVFVTYPSEYATFTLGGQALVINNQTVSVSCTVPTGYSASSVGPSTISGGVTVTLNGTARWVVS